MYFIPDNNKLFSWLITIIPFYRYFFTAILTALFSLGFYYNSFDVTGAVLARYIYKTDLLCTECKAIRLAQKQTKNLSKQVSLFHKTFDTYAANSPKGLVDEFAIFSMPHLQGSQIRDCSLGYVKDKGWCTKRAFRTRFSGNLSDAIAFMKTTQLAPGFIRYRTIVATRSAINFYDLDLLLESISL